MNARIEQRIEGHVERQTKRQIDWRLVLGFIVAWLGATGALVAADIAAAPADQAPQAIHRTA